MSFTATVRRMSGWSSRLGLYLFTTPYLQGERSTVSFTFFLIFSTTQPTKQVVGVISGLSLLLKVGKKKKKRQNNSNSWFFGTVQTWQQRGRQRDKMHHKDERVWRVLGRRRFLSGKLHLSFSRLRVARYFANSQKCGPPDTDD